MDDLNERRLRKALYLFTAAVVRAIIYNNSLPAPILAYIDQGVDNRTNTIYFVINRDDDAEGR
jgi:hypothetical protein